MTTDEEHVINGVMAYGIGLIGKSYIPVNDPNNGWEDNPNNPGESVSAANNTPNANGKSKSKQNGDKVDQSVSDPSQGSLEPSTFFYIQNNLGSVVGLTDPNGKMITKYHYDEFGVTHPDVKFDKNWPGPNNMFGYTGSEYDTTTNLNYAHARYYMPEFGRFISKDPSAGVMQVPLTQNGYSYVENNPVNLIDPTGMSSTGIEGAIRKGFAITGAFEGAGFANLAGDFDGQGLSFGFLQWNIGQGTLQPLLSRMASEYSDVINSVFGDKAGKLREVLGYSRNQQLSWAKSINNANDRVIDPWKSMFIALGNTKEFQEIQMAAAQNYVNTAISLIKQYGLKTERAYALMFDIAVQNGSITSSARNKINSRMNSNQSEKEKLAIIANAVAESAYPQYVEDVRGRKMTIVNGTGRVHGGQYNLYEDYGLTDAEVL